MKKLKVLFLSSENAATSIPLELAGILKKHDEIDLKVVTYYGVLKDNFKSQFVDDIIDLNLKGKNIYKSFSTIRKIIKDFKPDVVHVHHNLSALITIIAAKLSGVKKIIKTEHNFHRNYKWHQKVLNVPILSMSDIIIGNSKSTLDSFYSWEKRLTNKKKRYIYNGINIQQILSYANHENIASIRNKYSIQPNEKLFFSASRFTKQKNLDNLLKAFVKASGKNKDVKLILAGDGELKESLLKLKSEIDVNDKIIFTGMLSRSDVFKLMNAADFFVVVSLWEGYCNAAVEAMVGHCPLLCSDIVTLKEVVGNTGKFVDPLSVEKIENGILDYAAMNKETYRELSNQTYERAVKLYSIETAAKQYIESYFN